MSKEINRSQTLNLYQQGQTDPNLILHANIWTQRCFTWPKNSFTIEISNMWLELGTFSTTKDISVRALNMFLYQQGQTDPNLILHANNLDPEVFHMAKGLVYICACNWDLQHVIGVRDLFNNQTYCSESSEHVPILARANWPKLDPPCKQFGPRGVSHGQRTRLQLGLQFRPPKRDWS